VPKRGKAGSAVKVDDLTAVEDPAGSFGIIEFKGALPKVKRFSNWSVNTNELAVLNRLSDLQFDPAQQVIVMDQGVRLPPESALENAGSAEITSYHPKRIEVKSSGDEHGVLLLNDRFHHHWNVYVDGEQKPLLRCNYIMRGVELPPGEQVIEFRYEPPQTGLAISLSSIGLGGIICLYLWADRRKKTVAGSVDQEL